LIRKIIRKGLQTLGYELKRVAPAKKNALDLMEEAETAAQKVAGHTMLSILKLATLYEQVAYCEKNNIPGALVECGVWKGGAVGIMALANLQYGKKRRPLYLFDSFDDICEPDPEVDGALAVKDVEGLLGRKIENLSGRTAPIKGVYDSRGGHGTIETCRALLVDQLKYEESMLHFCKGWFEDSLPREAPQINQIALLRLDADWYKSTKICLDYLYDKVVPGGFIIFDDYGRYEGCKKAVEDFFVERKIRPFLYYADHQHGECRFFIKQN